MRAIARPHRVRAIGATVCGIEARDKRPTPRRRGTSCGWGCCDARRKPALERLLRRGVESWRELEEGRALGVCMFGGGGILVGVAGKLVARDGEGCVGAGCGGKCCGGGGRNEY